ncbi:hypothetical protein LTR78_002859 [Recurvomyces mirabilis]|uniref:Fe2OG dioxygenase domain-containing protein n=1 Tax=Recurvomyces mirabilis TaxID=574656 RepID=A0AAE0WSZ9_9PEZI|nr:hypothetical protein LTR78_002859 [Recurvomyces mirabilis]KAK5159408.1 hypothetical protein LTS14_002550 [Recurvomyces mirabilis]
MSHGDILYGPPSGPPPILLPAEVHHIARHGWLPVTLPEHLSHALQRLQVAACDFFSLEAEQKRLLYPLSRGTECGFYEVPAEKQYVTIRHTIHDSSCLETCAREVSRDATAFLHRILCDISRAGGYGLDAWNGMLDGSHEMPEDAKRLDDVTTQLRLFQYEPMTGIATEHVDIGLLTLCVSDTPGLQVLDRFTTPHRWIDTIGPIVLVGDMTRALFRSQVRAGMHRVAGNPDGRNSIVYALRPCLKGMVDLASWGGEGQVDTRDYFLKIKGSRHNINATHDIRETQKSNQLRKCQVVLSGTG